MDRILVALRQAPMERVALLAAAILIFYFLPSLVAVLRRRENLGRFAALNLATGWTLAAWAGLLVWAFTGKKKD